MHAPSVSDFNLLKRIMRYIKGTITMGISFNNNTDCTLTALVTVIGATAKQPGAPLGDAVCFLVITSSIGLPRSSLLCQEAQLKQSIDPYQKLPLRSLGCVLY